MINVLLVCSANICRSPMATQVAIAMMKAGKIRDASIEPFVARSIAFESAGTHVTEASQRIDSRAQAALLRRGYPKVGGRSRRVTERDFVHFDLILAMDRSNLAALQQMCPVKYTGKLRLFLDFAPGLEGEEVPDPYFGNAEGFERVLDLCEAGVRGLACALVRDGSRALEATRNTFPLNVGYQ